MKIAENMIPVNSSNVKAIGYEDGDLFVEYPSGTYVYKNVPKELYDELQEADSKGSFMNMYIKGIYNYDYIR